MMESLDDDLIRILEDLFDGDDYLPNADDLEKKVDALEGQLAIFFSAAAAAAQAAKAGDPAALHL